MLGTRRSQISSAAWRSRGGASTTPPVRPAAWPWSDQRQYRGGVPTRRELRGARWADARWNVMFLISGLPLWAGAMLMLSVWTAPIRQIYRADDADGAIRFALSVVVVLVLLLTLAPVLTEWQRRRFRGFRGLEIHPIETPRLYRGQIRQTMRSEALWRQVLYHLIAGPLIGIGLVLLAFLAGIAVLVAVKLPAHALGLGHYAGALSDEKFWGQVAYVVLAGGATFFAPRVIHFLAGADELAARRLLGPSEAIVLARRVQTLSDSRAAAVQAADAERRRIERDLHDGAQQRLVSLAMNLGIARATLTDLPPDARAAIDRRPRARPRQAMAELREPGARPAPGRARRPRPGRRALRHRRARTVARRPHRRNAPDAPSAAVEAVAYFVVSEALANVAKHARAAAAAVEVGRRRPRPAVHRQDDGVGGADPRRRHRPDRAGAAAPPRSTAPSPITSPLGGPDRHDRGAAVRAVIAEDSVLLRIGLTRVLEVARDRRIRGRRRGRRRRSLLRAVEQHRPDARRRRRPDAARLHRRGRTRRPADPPGMARIPRCCCSRNTSRSATPPTCWPPSTGGIGYLLKDRVADVDGLHRRARTRRRRRHRAGPGGRRPAAAAPAQPDPLDRLTPRERDVLALMAEGRSNAAIADRRSWSARARWQAHQQHLHQARPAARRPWAPPRPGRIAIPGGAHPASPLTNLRAWIFKRPRPRDGAMWSAPAYRRLGTARQRRPHLAGQLRGARRIRNDAS